MRRWTEESTMDGWRLVREKLTQMPMKCIVTGQAGVFANFADIAVGRMLSGEGCLNFWMARDAVAIGVDRIADMATSSPVAYTQLRSFHPSPSYWR